MQPKGKLIRFVYHGRVKTWYMVYGHPMPWESEHAMSL